MSRGTNKQKTITALHKTIDSLERGEHEFNEEKCPICTPFRNESYSCCEGCPFASVNGRSGCVDYLENIVEEVETIGMDEYSLLDRIVEETVALLLRLAESHLYGMPSKQFTKRKWSFVDWNFLFSIHEQQIRTAIERKLRKEV